MSLSDRIQVTHNARGLGGTPTADGRVIAPVLFRSDALGALTEAGHAALAELGIGTVVDLRTDAERQRSADALPADGSVRLVTLSISGGAMDEMVGRMLASAVAGEALSAEQIEELTDALPTLAELYVAILGSSAAQFAAYARTVIEAAATDRPGVIVHCTAGKDRTGIATALLLEVAGVDRETIIADYVQTETNLAGPFAESLTGLITRLGVPLTPKLDALATKSPREAIVAVLDWVAAEHSDAAGYLRSGGLTDAELATLRDVLRAEP